MAFIGLERIQRRVQSTGETFVAPLAFPILDVFADAPFFIAGERVNTMIGDPEVLTIGIGAGVTLGGDALLETTCALALEFGAHRNA
jgi:hypothetical protein